MNNDVVKLYNDELVKLRKQGSLFADSHPKIASRLKLGQGGVEDPLVGRLIEATAFLTAKLRYQLQDDNQAIDSDLMQLLYPHYFLPIPACSTVQFSPNEKLEKPYCLAKKTAIKTVVGEKSDCIFTTVYPITIRPIALSNISYQREGRVAPKQHAPKVLKSSLSFTVSSINEKASLQDAALDNIRLFINAELPIANQLRELLLAHTKEIVLVVDETEINLPASAIKAVGLESDENLLPYLPNSFIGYQLLTEYFAYPEKFMYLDMVGLDNYIAKNINSITVHCFFDSLCDELLDQIDDITLQLHSTPIVNLFDQQGEPIIFDHSQTYYHVIADKQRKLREIEIYTIQSVTVDSPTYKNYIDCAPYFGRSVLQQSQHYLYWHEKHEPCSSFGEVAVSGDEVLLSFSDINLDSISEELSLTPNLLCTNRELANLIPFGGGKPIWNFTKNNHESIASIRCVRGIQSAQYRARQHQRQQVAQHVYLNQIGLADNTATLENLHLLLAHYHQEQVHHKRVIHDGLIGANCKAITIRHPSKLQQGFCRGLQYTLTVEEKWFADNELYLFGSVLHQFLTKSCTMNGFVSLTILNKQQEECFAWQPILGTKPRL
jgi:type VI secretion system protein ImpG